jgi:LacI family transcriptional regulator, repressor for deo operon, udp, cdd, tsx, nupC, and nupG
VKRNQLTDLIRQKIETGHFQRGLFLPAERLLAAELGVSRPTLRRALEPLVKAGLLANHPGIGTRVVGPENEAEDRMWRIIALLLPDITNRFFSEVTESIEYTALQRGYQLLLCNSRHQVHLEEWHIRHLVERRVDGVILAHDPTQDLPASMDLLIASGIPTVLLFSSAHQVNCDSVILDNAAGVDQGLRYLFSLGHRGVAFVRPVQGNRPHPRETEYRNMLQKSGYSPVVLELLGLDDDAAKSAVQEVLDRRDAPTAFFAGNDHMAVRLMKHLTALGVRVPDQISVLGFDNLRMVEHLPVPLTTIDQPKQEMGRRAVELLFERMTAGPDLPVQREIFSPHLIIRNSCARPWEQGSVEGKQAAVSVLPA